MKEAPTESSESIAQDSTIILRYNKLMAEAIEQTIEGKKLEQNQKKAILAL